MDSFHFPDGVHVVEEFVPHQLVCQLDEDGALVVFIAEVLRGELSDLETQPIVHKCLLPIARFIIHEIVDGVNNVLTFIHGHLVKDRGEICHHRII